MLHARRSALLLTVMALGLITAACEQQSINRIKADPSRYSNREVAITGNVVQSMSLLGRGVYEVDDGTGRLWVVSEKGVPRKGARVVVKGTIRDAFNLGALISLPEPVGSGLVMMEIAHKAGM